MIQETGHSGGLRIVYAGTPEFAVAPLQALLDSHHQVVAVYTQPDRPAGRGRKLTASPVKQLAQANNIEINQPVTLKDPEQQQLLAAYQPDLMIVVAYGLILPQAVLDIPRLGCLNIHASLLPRWRGAAPIQRSIQAGDAETGVTIMQMEAGLDTGPILYMASTSIGDEETAAELHDRLSLLGAGALLTALADLELLQSRAEIQDDSLACYADKLTKAEAELDWQTDAETLARQVRAFNPWPVAFTTWKGEPLRIWRARPLPGTSSATPGTVIQADRDGIQVATGKGILCLQEIQPPGKRPMAAGEFVNAHAIQGDRLGAA